MKKIRGEGNNPSWTPPPSIKEEQFVFKNEKHDLSALNLFSHWKTLPSWGWVSDEPGEHLSLICHLAVLREPSLSSIIGMCVCIYKTAQRVENICVCRDQKCWYFCKVLKCYESRSYSWSDLPRCSSSVQLEEWEWDFLLRPWRPTQLSFWQMNVPPICAFKTFDDIKTGS